MSCSSAASIHEGVYFIDGEGLKRKRARKGSGGVRNSVALAYNPRLSFLVRGDEETVPCPGPRQVLLCEVPWLLLQLSRDRSDPARHRAAGAALRHRLQGRRGASDEV